MATKKPLKTNYRDAKTGKFVTEKYVQKHPKTTTTEHNPKRSSKK